MVYFQARSAYRSLDITVGHVSIAYSEYGMPINTCKDYKYLEASV